MYTPQAKGGVANQVSSVSQSFGAKWLDLESRILVGGCEEDVVKAAASLYVVAHVLLPLASGSPMTAESWILQGLPESYTYNNLLKGLYRKTSPAQSGTPLPT